MPKQGELLTQAQWEGAEAATEGRARSTNPYPQSDIAARNQWFGGYDRKIEQLSVLERSPRTRRGITRP
jgi:ribosome modulation factor